MPDLESRLMEAVDKFEMDLGFTAPELTGMRIEQLRERIRTALEDCQTPEVRYVHSSDQAESGDAIP
jgi:hypothetical protein